MQSDVVSSANSTLFVRAEIADERTLRITEVH
jgi:hypothetical protein